MLVTRLAGEIGARTRCRHLSARRRRPKPRSTRSGSGCKTLREKLAGIRIVRRAQPAGHCRCAGAQERVDPGRRRLGLRHRLRRTGPRARLGQERERAGARYRGLLEHRRADVEGHAARRGGEVCRQRQAEQPQRPGHGSRELRLGLRGAGGAGRQRHATW